ncbi:MAG TPA: Ppx/GppA phosphatase family protein, partial [Vulgatibacteraceae bacterium]|nr:Ppx/GppA phosphatase family protein [Vulgatibacteraceae bacterium]
MTRVAAVDCGTNSVRLLIADIVPGEGGGTLTDVERRMEIVRLGEGVDETGRLSPAALERTFTAMRGYADLIERHGARAGKGPIKTRVVATSATRDAENRSDFVNGVVDIFGVVPEVISGDEEAELSFTGATRELAALRPARPYLVVDIGGGSTEFVLGATEPEQLISVDMGCVRMTERHLTSNPPTEAQLRACFVDVQRVLETVRARVDVARARRMIGVAGTVTTLAALHKGLTHYDPVETHHAVLTREAVEALYARLSRTT